MNNNNRIIKFRAWDTELGKMEHQIDYEGGDNDDRSKWLQIMLGDFDYREYVPMQFIGLKDKNGKEIYEGDIVKENQYIEAIKWSDELNNCGCCFPEFRGCGFYTTNISCYNKCEVIGNIYENPDLIN